MATVAERRPQHSNAYNIFILVLTVWSLLIMVLLLLPISPATRDLLTAYDNMICIVFLIDFTLNLRNTRPRRQYIVDERGWLDLLGSIPTIGLFQFGALLRLARLSRLARITRLMRGDSKKRLLKDIVENRGQYAMFITLLAAFVVLSGASVMVLQFESVSPDANITTGGDALWWGLVTITTVGYGDKFPVTSLGRMTGVAVMFAGVGIIGALASILASILVPPAPDTTDRDAETREQFTGQLDALQQELAGVREELRALRGEAGRDPTPGP